MIYLDSISDERFELLDDNGLIPIEVKGGDEYNDGQHDENNKDRRDGEQNSSHHKEINFWVVRRNWAGSNRPNFATTTEVLLLRYNLGHL